MCLMFVCVYPWLVKFKSPKIGCSLGRGGDEMRALGCIRGLSGIRKGGGGADTSTFIDGKGNLIAFL